MSMTYTTTEAARGRDADWELRHGPTAADVTTVWDFDGGQSLELTVGELEEYEQAEGVTLDEDIIGPQRFASLLEWLREEELLEQPVQGSPAPKEQQAQHTPGPWIVDATPAHAPCWFTIRHNSAICGALAPLATIHTTSGDTMANARLIAAAPDLLELLETVLKRLDMEHAERIAKGEERPRFICAAMREDLRAAIAKAKGPTEYDLAKQQAAAWRAKAARDDHPGRGFCLEQAERWEARAGIAKAKGGAR